MNDVVHAASTPGLPRLPRLLQALAEVARRYPLDRKLLVCVHETHGRELLRALAHAGESWIGFDVTTPPRLARDLVAVELALEDVRLTDEFDELALIDEAMDRTFAESPDGLAELAEGFGLRQAIVRAVRGLRLAGVGEEALERARFRDERKRAQIARILSLYERGLVARQLTDTAGALRRATAALAVGTVTLPYDRVFILPGQARRGLPGQLLQVLLERGAEVLPTDPVFGLSWPAGWLDAPGVADTTPEDAVRAGATRLSWLHSPATAPPVDGVEVQMFAATSMVSELREVLRRALDAGLRWDEVEIVATDPTAYGVALDALARRLGIPVSYAMGLPIARTRPGRAVATYLDWIQTGFPADVLRQMLERGDIAPVTDTGHSATALARRLRRLKIGRGRERYGQALDRRRRELAAPQAPDDERSPEEFAEQRARDLAELAALEGVILPLLEATPPVPDRPSDPGSLSPAALARGLLALLRLVPIKNAVDATAHARLSSRLERIAATLTRETTVAGAIAVVQNKLDARVPAPDEPGIAPWTTSGGYLHLSDLEHGGLACRRATFVVGLDSGRMPGGVFADALLVDDDRRRIALGAGEHALPTTAERIEERRYAFAALVARLRGSVTFSYAAWDAVEGRAVAPSAELLQLHRLVTGPPTADYEALHKALSPAVSPVPRRPGAALDDDDVLLGVLAHENGLRSGVSAVLSVFPGLNAGVQAFRERKASEPSARHGIVRPRPSFDPRDSGRTVSASQLERLGTCPLRYLQHDVLRIRKPDDPELSSEEWLNALERGSLMHRVYEGALASARAEGLALTDHAFEERALEILAREAEALRAVLPPPGDAIYRMECELLAEDVRAFVAMVREDGDRHIALEQKFGRDGEPAVTITLPDGRSLSVAGAIDRVDRLDDGRLVIIDYKTGSKARFTASKRGVFDGGRRLQHVVYSAVARTIFGADVARAEYHFPTRASENDRAVFPAERLQDGLAIVSTLLDLAARGHFVPTTDEDDCGFCDFAAACRVIHLGYGRHASPMARWAAASESDVLDPLRQLRR